MTRRRILWVSHLVPYPPVAGVLLRSFNLVKAIGRAHELSLVAFIQDVWLETCFGTRERGLIACRAALEPLCHSVRFLDIESLARRVGRVRAGIEGLFADGGYPVRWLQGPRAHREMSAIAATERFDLVHFDTIALTPFSKYFGDTRKSLGHHNIESHMLVRRATNAGNPVKRAYFHREGMRLERYEQRVCSQFDINIVCSDLDGERLKKISPDCSIATIENGVDCEYFRTADAPQKSHSLIFVGTMNWYPNVDAVLFFLSEVWDALKSRHPQLTFDVVGSNPPASVREAARGREGVTIHGFVDDIRPLLDAATLFVCPIRDGGGTKLKILDAFSMQKCVVAHPVACEGIDVTPAVNVEFAMEPLEWVERISALLTDPARRLQMGLEARLLAQQRYSFDQIGERLAGLFDRLVDGGPTASAAR